MAISDGLRTDKLLCMAILTQKRLEKQGGYMFHPDYQESDGIYSDNEFTERAYADGVVIEADAAHIVFESAKSKQRTRFELTKFLNSNQSTSVNQKVKCVPRQKVKRGDLLADGSSMQDGELALGQNLRVGFMSYEGSNFEDAIIISDRLVKDDVFTSVHIEDFSIDVSDTRLGEEQVTGDIPNVSEERLKDLDAAVS